MLYHLYTEQFCMLSMKDERWWMKDGLKDEGCDVLDEYKWWMKSSNKLNVSLTRSKCLLGTDVGMDL